MIISGLQTGNTRWLAAHLQNAADNEDIEIAEVTGTVAIDIDGALAEFDAIAAGTRATEGVYAAFINPPQPFTPEQYARAIEVIEQRLGLDGQPRMILFHRKNGREHCHIVWSRIDLARMRAIHLSHDRQKLRSCARQLAAEFGLPLPDGLAHDRGAERFSDPPQPTRAEKAMEAASGLSWEERRALVTEAYRQADSAKAFVNALEAAGFMLARGARRGYVIVDAAGDVHSLARQIDGAKTKDVKKKLEGILLSSLPPVERAKILMLQRAAARHEMKRAQEKKRRVDKEILTRIEQAKKARRKELDLLRQQMNIRHMHERKVLLAHILAERERRLARRHFLAVGLALYLKKIAIIRQLIEYYENRRKRAAEEQFQLMIQGLRRRHENEKAELRRRYLALERLERRERQTFERVFGGTASQSSFEPYSARLPTSRSSIAVTQDDFAFGHSKPVETITFAQIDVLSQLDDEIADLPDLWDVNAADPPNDPMTSHNFSVSLQPHYDAHRDFQTNAIDITTPRRAVIDIDQREYAALTPSVATATTNAPVSIDFRINAAQITGASDPKPSSEDDNHSFGMSMKASVSLDAQL